MMDRALKESLDAGSTQDADSVNEQRMLEMALKASLATSKNTKVHDNATVVLWPLAVSRVKARKESDDSK